MSYIALARKWRPKSFSQLVGQEHITKTLTKSLQQNRVHHAYLFTGTRGVGKTSIARLLAKALNCQQAVSPEPCLTCDACVAIEQGNYIDLIEIDAASKTRVEDTRELLDNVQYAPTAGRFKIYLIDEVHMLSQHSFNALLKTLEEPPAHVKFLLATTDPQKLPITVLSRCLQFNLKPIIPEIIYTQLAQILQHEQVTFEPLAVHLLVKAAKGSMRDALSLLDQAIACSDKALQACDIKTMLGYTQQDYALALLQALSRLDVQAMIAISRQIAATGGQFPYVAEEMLSHLHQIAVIQAIPSDNPLITTIPELNTLSKTFTPEDIQLFYQIVSKSLAEMKLAPTLTIGFEMMLLRLYAFRPYDQKVETQLAYQCLQTEQPIQKSLTDSSQQTTTNKSEPLITVEATPQQNRIANSPLEQVINTVNEQPFDSATPDKEQSSAPSLVEESWNEILSKLKLSGLALTAAVNAELISHQDNRVKLRLAKGHLSLFTPTVIKRIEQGLTNYYKKVVKLVLEAQEATVESPMEQQRKAQSNSQEKATEALHADSFFQQLKQELSAELEKDSVSLLN